MQNVIERILNLLAFLLSVVRPVTADEIRTTVAGYGQASDEAFRRMFERDKELLRRLGVPLELKPTDVWEVEDGYVVPPDQYALENPGLTDEERAALWLAAQVVRIGGQASGPDALFKLGGAPSAGAVEPLAVDLGAASEILGDVFLAVCDRRLIDFDYRGSRRRVAPYGLVHRRGHWYMVGPERSDMDGIVKAFRIDRAADLQIGEETGVFDRPKSYRASDAIPHAPWEAGEDSLIATVRFDQEVAWWARRQLSPTTETVDHSDGSMTANVVVANREAFFSWMIGFDAGAEVVAPPAVRQEFVSRLLAGAIE